MVNDQKPVEELSRKELEKFCQKNLNEAHEWHREAEDLRQENHQFREALEEIANPTSSLEGFDDRQNLIKIAQQALDEGNSE